MAADLQAAKDAYLAGKYTVAVQQLTKFETNASKLVTNQSKRRVLLAVSTPLKEWMKDLGC
ncbi:hypothetical protein [Phytohabitans rumicis]|uniref:Uncharacterized protein n=1 Tax=Phytohabitans rumicis TaxID=1076125 RepID=A0A6V8L8B1_9ACTN|nr:hypothetical protein [Phytohabitans rumicis]GFJ93492.1 hypothetical protein Prum_071340 [Phytohabitans rumicis]